MQMPEKKEIGIMYLGGAFYNEKLIKNNNGVEGDGND
jgi:hypothetical protein